MCKGEGSILLSCSASRGSQCDYDVAEEKSDNEGEGEGEMSHFERRQFSTVEICV